MNDNQNFSVTEGLWKNNTVLSAGMIISPIIICADTFKNAVALLYAFSLITFFTSVIGATIPKKLPYTLKVILSAIIGSLIYVPIKMLTTEIYPESIENIGIYFPLIAVNSLIVYQLQNTLRNLNFKKTISSIIFYILGFDVVILIVGCIREMLAFGTLNNQIIDVGIHISGVGKPFGGFIILGVLCGIYRKVHTVLSREDSDGNSPTVTRSVTAPPREQR